MWNFAGWRKTNPRRLLLRRWRNWTSYKVNMLITLKMRRRFWIWWFIHSLWDILASCKMKDISILSRNYLREVIYSHIIEVWGISIPSKLLFMVHRWSVSLNICQEKKLFIEISNQKILWSVKMDTWSLLISVSQR